LKAQEPYNRAASQCYKKIKGMQEKVVSLINQIKSNEKVIKNCDLEILRQESVRDAFLVQHRIRKYSKSKESAEIRANFRNNLNRIRSYKREYEKQVRKQKKALTTAEEELKTSEVKYQEKKIIALQTGKLVHRFKELLDSCWQEFELKRLRFIKILKSSPCKIARNLLKIVKSNVRVFNDKKEEIQAIIHPNRVNTNTIESLFGKYRLFYKKYRKTKNTKYAQAIFELLRLNHNLSLPYTGFDRNRSPLMRIGIHTKFHNAIERLCCQGS
jgi:hypothetical protein